MAAVAEDVDAFGAFDLGGLDLRPLRPVPVGVGCCACAAGMVKTVINAAAAPARYTRDMVFTPWFSGEGAGLPQRRPASDYSARADDTIGEVFRHSDARNLGGWSVRAEYPRVDAKETPNFLMRGRTVSKNRLG